MSQLTLSAVLKIVDEATRPLKQIQNQSELNSDSIEELTRAMQQLNRTMGGSNASRYTSTLRENRQQLQLSKVAIHAIVREYDRVSHTLSMVISKTTQWSQSLKAQRALQFQKIKGNALSMLGMGYAASIPVKAFAEAEDASMKLKVSMMDSSGKVASEFQNINELATKLGSRLPGTNADFQLMMATLVQQGISFKSILGGTGEAAGNLAVLLKMPFDEAAEFAAKMQDATQTAEKDMLSLMDTIQRTSYLGVDPSNMLGGFAKLGAGMKTIRKLGLEGANAMAPLLVMADQSGMSDLSSAGNALSKTFKAMLDQGKIDKALAGTKIKMDFSDGKGEFGGMDKMFKQLEKLKNFSTQARLPIISDIFGNDAENIQILNLLIDKGKAGYDDTIAKMQRQADLQTRINAQLSTLTNLWDQAKGSATNAMVTIVEAIAPDLKEFVKQISATAEKINAWAKANPELIQTIFKVVKAFIMFKLAMFTITYTGSLVFGTIFSMIAGITKLTLAIWLIQKLFSRLGIGVPSRFKIYSTVVRLVSKAFFFLARQAIPLVIMGLRAMAVAMLTNPLTLIIALIAVVALAIYRYWGPIKVFFKGFWDGLKIGLAPMMDSIQTAFNNFKAALAPLQPVWDGLVGAWQTFKGVLGEMLTPFQATNQELQNATSYGQALGQFIGVLVGIFTEAFMSIGTWLGETAAKIVIFVQQAIAAWDSFKASVMSVGAVLLDHLLSPLRAVINGVNILINGLNKIPMVNIPTIPQIPNFNQPNGQPTTTAKIPLKTQAVTPLKAAGAAAPVTNHFAGAQISITGVTDPKQVGQIIDQKLKQHQTAQAAAQRRTFSDKA